MEIWIPVDVSKEQVAQEIQQWLDKYSFHAYKSIVQDRINSRYPSFTTLKALYIMHLENRQVINIEPHENTKEPQMVLCSICHEEDLQPRQTLICNHSFHYHCIQRWFRVNNTCPLCRITI